MAVRSPTDAKALCDDVSGSMSFDCLRSGHLMHAFNQNKSSSIQLGLLEQCLIVPFPGSINELFRDFGNDNGCHHLVRLTAGAVKPIFE